MKSQNATATLGNVTSCAGETVLVPLNVAGFNDVGAMTIYISYDTNAVDFLSLQNINPAIPGSLSVNDIDGHVNIAYSFINPFTIEEGKLFDLSFSFLADSSLLPFLPGTEIANSNLEVIPLDTFTGSIKNSIQIINQPENVQSYPDNDVIFRVTSSGNASYQWQENSGSNWYDLQNNSTYSGVNDDTLRIFDVPLNFNGNLYRCLLTSGNCADTTATALLEVATAFPVLTLGYINSCPESEINEPVLAGDFYDVIEFTLTISFDTNALNFQGLENIHPELLPGEFLLSPLESLPGISIHWINEQPVSVNSGKLFDLFMSYDENDQLIAFTEGTIVLNSFFNPVNITLNNGMIDQFALPYITSQPQNDTVTSPGNATFSVIATGNNEYQWELSADEGLSWIQLENSTPYSGVNTATLAINPAVLSMDGNLYKCKVNNENCFIYSSTARLVVDTLTYIDNPGKFEAIVYPNPFRDDLSVTIKGENKYNSARIYNTNGKLLWSCKFEDSTPGFGLTFDLSHLSSGLYILELSGVNENKIKDRIRIIKTK